ncbi:hypothetical protein [Paenarthrobacter nicotinovorans]|jgi:hypothetical protein|uniref:hypothetical protein n=1 Tax=Paenarthrobacter nicotinovorans TaxID=29320 RepID=UPI003D67E0B5
MNRTAAGEAKRQVALAETMYRRLVEKNRQAEQNYLAKIETLKATHAELQEAEAA